MLILGLTGGIATGKSTVAEILKHQDGVAHIDADLIARQVVEPGQPAYNKIVSYYGPDVPGLIRDDDRLDRTKLGKAVFGDEIKRKILNSFVHPYVRKAMLCQVLKAWLTGQAVAVLDVPLLFEAHLDVFCASTVVVWCDPELQKHRLQLRDPALSEEDVERRISSQMSLQTKRELADIAISNNGSHEDLRLQALLMLQTLRPSRLRTWADWIPLFGLIHAVWIFVKRKRRNSRTMS